MVYAAALWASGLAGFGLGAYLTEYTHWITGSVLVTALLLAASVLAMRRFRAQTDPAFFAFRRVAYLIAIVFAGGFVMSLGGAGFAVALTRQSPPAEWAVMHEVALAVMMGASGLWWLSWPRSHPQYGSGLNRWVSWSQIGAAAFLVLLAVMQFLR